MQVVVNESHTQFIEHVIFIMKNVLENSNSKNEQPAEHLGVTSIEGMMLAIVRSVEFPFNSSHFKPKLTCCCISYYSVIVS